jgi:hypothetical protein
VELKVQVENASLDDVVGVIVDQMEDEVTDVTLGDVVIEALIARLTQDPRWGDLAGRFAEAVDQYFRDAAPGYVEGLVAAEVTRQLGDWSQGALTRGKPSTRAEAIVATEVTAQLRGQFAPVVGRALTNLAHDLQVLSGDAMDAFWKGTGR